MSGRTQRHLAGASCSADQEIGGRSIVSTPFIEAFWFTDGLNAGRQDQIYSVSLGLKYNIASNVSLTTNVIYEARTSNVPLRHYTDVQIGPRLDFAF